MEYFVQVLPHTISHKGLEAVCCSTGEPTRLSVNINGIFFTIGDISDILNILVACSTWDKVNDYIATKVYKLRHQCFQAVSVNFPVEISSSHSLLMLSQSRQLAPRLIQKALLGACLFLDQEGRRVECGKSEESMWVLGVHRQLLHQVANQW